MNKFLIIITAFYITAFSNSFAQSNSLPADMEVELSMPDSLIIKIVDKFKLMCSEIGFAEDSDEHKKCVFSFVEKTIEKTRLFSYLQYELEVPTASEEIEEIIERKIREARELNNKEKDTNQPKVEKFITTYYEFPGNFTTNLKGSRKFLQAGIGVSTQYDAVVIENVENHQLELRSGILAVMSEFSEEDIQGKTGRDNLAKAITKELNKKLEKLEGFGGIEKVHFTSFMLQ